MKRIVRQRLVLLAAAAVGLLGIGVAVTALFGQWRWAAVLAAASVVSLAAVGVGLFLRQGELLRLQRREAARARRIEERRRRFEHRQLPDTVDGAVQRALHLLGDRSDVRTDLLEQTILASVQVLRDDIADSVGRTAAAGGRLAEGVQPTGGNGKELAQSLSREVREQLRVHEQMLIAEIDALRQLHRRFPIDGPLPLLGGWALKPTGLLQLLDLALARPARTVVECGSGVSTVYLAWLLRQQPGARLIALEHQEEFAGATRDRLQDLGLEHVAEIRLAPLEPTTVDAWSGDWYALDAVRDLDAIDLLLVDGPPQSSGKLARYPALPVLEDRMSHAGVVLLDDVNRSEERAVLEAWLDGGRWQTGRSSNVRQAVLRRTPAV